MDGNSLSKRQNIWSTYRANSFIFDDFVFHCRTSPSALLCQQPKLLRLLAKFISGLPATQPDHLPVDYSSEQKESGAGPEVRRTVRTTRHDNNRLRVGCVFSWWTPWLSRSLAATFASLTLLTMMPNFAPSSAITSRRPRSWRRYVQYSEHQWLGPSFATWDFSGDLLFEFWDESQVADKFVDHSPQNIKW